MKWIIAPEKENHGKGKKDFCFTTPGEILIPWGIKCSRGYPEDDCGCCRAFSGLESRVATTVAVIGETDMPILDIIVKDMKKFLNDDSKEIDSEWLDTMFIEYGRIRDQLSAYEIGQRVGVKFLPHNVLMHQATIFIAGTDNKNFGV